jgi:hypothetical protein
MPRSAIARGSLGQIGPHWHPPWQRASFGDPPARNVSAMTTAPNVLLSRPYRARRGGLETL